MPLIVVIVLIAAIIAACIPKPEPELRGDTPAEQLADIGKGCGNIIIGIIAFAVFIALITWAGNANIDQVLPR
jgi:hypothetical protein